MILRYSARGLGASSTHMIGSKGSRWTRMTRWISLIRFLAWNERHRSKLANHAWRGRSLPLLPTIYRHHALDEFGMLPDPTGFLRVSDNEMLSMSASQAV